MEHYQLPALESIKMIYDNPQGVELNYINKKIESKESSSIDDELMKLEDNTTIDDLLQEMTSLDDRSDFLEDAQLLTAVPSSMYKASSEKLSYANPSDLVLFPRESEFVSTQCCSTAKPAPLSETGELDDVSDEFRVPINDD